MWLNAARALMRPLLAKYRDIVLGPLRGISDAEFDKLLAAEAPSLHKHIVQVIQYLNRTRRWCFTLG